MFKATPNPPKTDPTPHHPEFESQKTKEAADRALDFYLVTARLTVFQAGKKSTEALACRVFKCKKGDVGWLRNFSVPSLPTSRFARANPPQSRRLYPY
ncbi:hypothetical protein C3E98_007415 [Pseudomonas sp. MWU13-2625]|jgi:hypothetical protein|uniref:Uncharacterized protein n=1 Tax=Pseudomonas fluorescens R124 TaxID=743713 RepID=A0A7U9CLF5_PSEFL|nr:hypothetical protein I1A_001796 [Pseudomonas fluorescens R124]RBL72367.1 hypothetical protein C3E98_007415 [Pseudomonas sp. MWU13-2625]